MFTSERITARTLNDFSAGTNPFCDIDHLFSKFTAMFDELETALGRGDTECGSRLLEWRSILKTFMQGHEVEAIMAANALCAA